MEYGLHAIQRQPGADEASRQYVFLREKLSGVGLLCEGPCQVEELGRPQHRQACTKLGFNDELKRAQRQNLQQAVHLLPGGVGDSLWSPPLLKQPADVRTP
jgi:hypothetical protein